MNHSFSACFHSHLGLSSYSAFDQIQRVTLLWITGKIVFNEVNFGIRVPVEFRSSALQNISLIFFPQFYCLFVCLHASLHYSFLLLKWLIHPVYVHLNSTALLPDSVSKCSQFFHSGSLLTWLVTRESPAFHISIGTRVLKFPSLKKIS